jgi:hypothetical protein
MRRLLLMLLLFSALASAQQENIRSAMCSLVNTTQTFFAMVMVIFTVLAVPLILIGIYLAVKKKEMKNTGIILIIAGVLVPVLLAMVYLMVPYIISALTGVEFDVMECAGG